MRKFGKAIDPERDFQLVLKEYRAGEDPETIDHGTIGQTRYQTELEYLRLTVSELLHVLNINALLESRREDPMTIEEVKFMVDPLGLRWDNTPEPEDEDLQNLAGFTVKKTIEPYTPGD